MARIRKTRSLWEKVIGAIPAGLAVFLISAMAQGGEDNSGVANRPETITVAAGSFEYRLPGEYLAEGTPVDAPLERVVLEEAIEIMRYQVTVGDYEACVSDGGCDARLGQGRDPAHLPVTGVSYRDAVAYASWLSRKTGEIWRLPTDREWSYVAGNRYVDDAVGVGKDAGNPATRWLAKYQKYADRGTGSDPMIRAPGSYGSNEFGIQDLSANIWEWTDTCYTRSRLDDEGELLTQIDNCGVRIAAGQHRAYITFFIQDAKGGGCSVGSPPDHLGFRLVRDTENGFFRMIMDWLSS